MLWKAVVFTMLVGAVHCNENQCTNKAVEHDDASSPNTMRNCSDQQINEKKCCKTLIHDQIHTELSASITYLTMSIHFSNYQNHRPGAAKLFLEHAIEERQHAKKLLQYLDMRGEKLHSTRIPSLTPYEQGFLNLKKALEKAIEVEKKVTTNIKHIIQICSGDGEGPVEGSNPPRCKKPDETDCAENDYQAVDFLTSEFLAEQYAGTRKLSEHISTLNRMHSFGHFAELMFDKTLLAE